jgi:hypothetical protein
MQLSNEEINERTGQIVDAAMKVHTFLGPGLTWLSKTQLSWS